jgi:hypothetical protein
VVPDPRKPVPSRQQPGDRVTEAVGMSLSRVHASGYPVPSRWDRTIFRSRGSPSGLCPEVLDVTGPARNLFFGPFIVLPTGSWLAVVEIGLCPEAACRGLWLDFGAGAGTDYTRMELPFAVAGRLKIEIRHFFREPGQAQVRLWLKRAALHGEIRFEGVTVERLGDLESSLAD